MRTGPFFTAICPAENWFAEFKDSDGKLYHSRVVFWGAFREGEDVIGFHSAEGESVLECCAGSDFVRYVHADDIGKM